MNPNCGASYKDSPHWIKNAKKTSINKNDSKSFQHAKKKPFYK